MKRGLTFLICLLLLFCLPVGARGQETSAVIYTQIPGEVLPSRLPSGTKGQLRAAVIDAPEDTALTWQWEASDPAVLHLTPEGNDSCGYEAVKPGTTVITATSDRGHTASYSVAVFTYADLHGLRLLQEGNDLWLQRGREADLEMILQEDAVQSRIQVIAVDGTQGISYLDSRYITAEKLEEGRTRVRIDHSAFTADSGSYYLCFADLASMPVAKLTIAKDDPMLLTWVLAAGAVLVLGCVVGYILKKKKKA